MKTKIERKKSRQLHIRKRVQGTLEKPRLAVYRSNVHIYCQIINDQTGKVLCAASDMKISTGSPVERAEKVGELIAAEAKKHNITTAVFDRSGYKFHGRVKALAESARNAGLKI